MIAIDMEMPKNCYECPMNQGEYTPNEIEKRYCHLTGQSFSNSNYKKRPTSCPMKELKSYFKGESMSKIDKETADEILKQTGIIDEALHKIMKLSDGKDATTILLAFRELSPMKTIADHVERLKNG